MKAQKILDYLFTILLILFPFGVIVRIPLIVSSYIYPMDFIISLIYIFFIYSYIKNPVKLCSTPIKPMLVFILFSAVGLIINSNWLRPQELLISSFYLIRLILYTSLLFAVKYTTQKFQKKLIYYLILSGFMVILFGFIQYFFYPALKNLYYLGWDEHLYRMFSTFLDPNFLGAFLVLLLLLNASIFFDSCSSSLIKGFLYRIKLLILGLGFFLNLIAIFLTYSRTAYIMLIVSIFVYLALIHKKRWIFGVLFISVIALFIVPKSFKIEGLNPLRTASSFERIKQDNHALAIFQSSPIWGIGFDTYRYAQIRYKFITSNIDTTHAGAGVPNSWLVILATTGVIGFLLYFNFWWQILKRLFEQNKAYSSSEINELESSQRNKVSSRIPQANNNYIIAATITSLIALFIGSFFENLLLYPLIMVWIYILSGTMVGSEP